MSAEPPGTSGVNTPAAPTQGKYPPYPAYDASAAPPSVAETIIAGRDLRVQHKSVVRPQAHPLPKPARPRAPKVTDVKMSRQAMRAHARCLRRHGAVLTDRLERLSRPRRRNIIYLWREHANLLPPEAIERFRSMLNADEPFKPDQAYEYFINCRKSKKKANAVRCSQIKRDMQTVVTDKRFVWARNATVAFARGIQQRLARPGHYALADGMLRLSNVIMAEICGYMKMRTPSRRATNSKAKFMMEMSDKVAVWIDEILSESDDRMLMMDFDEDDEVEKSLGGAENTVATSGAASVTSVAPAETPANTPGDTTPPIPPVISPGAHILHPGKWAGGGGGGGGGGGDDFADDFLNMMGGSSLLKGPTPAYLKFQGEMQEAFTILTDNMEKKGGDQLLSYGKFKQTYAEGADELKQAPDFKATEFNTAISGKLRGDLDVLTAAPITPAKIVPFMKEMIDICANYLSQIAEFNKDKGPAFKLLVQEMKKKPKDELYQKNKIKATYSQAATKLEKAKGLEADHDDPNLSQEIHSKLSNIVKSNTPAELQSDMADTLNITSKYLSQAAVDESERGPAFDILIKKLEEAASQDFTPEYEPLKTNFVAAYVLKSAPGLCNITPDPATAPIFLKTLHRVVDDVCPPNLKEDMEEVIGRCANYLSAFVRDREKALQIVLGTMKKTPTKELAKRANYAMDYGTGAKEIDNAPTLVPFLPIKDIADEMKGKLNKDTETVTPKDMKVAVQKNPLYSINEPSGHILGAVTDCSKILSQTVAQKSGVAGHRYNQSLLSEMMRGTNDKKLFKEKDFSQNYGEGGEVLKYAGHLEIDPNAENLAVQIDAELNTTVPTEVNATITTAMGGTVGDAAKHLAKKGKEKAEAVAHLVKLMKEEGEAPLGVLQGYDQTYNDGARRVVNADSLANPKVDKGAYENVHTKLKTLVEKKPNPDTDKMMPTVADEVAQFLAAPIPETAAEKRKVLGEMMARKGDAIIAAEGPYKITYTQGGKDIQYAPVGVTTAQEEAKKKKIEGLINDAIPNKNMKELLHDPAEEGAAYLADRVQGVGSAMAYIQGALKKEGEKEFLNVGKFEKTHAGAGDMLSSAPNFGGENPNGMIKDVVKGRLNNLDKTGATDLAKKHMNSAINSASDYIADVATKECGLDAKAIAAWKASGAGGAGEIGAGGRGMGDEAARLARLRAEQEAARRKRKSGGDTDADEAERREAMDILHRQLLAKGAETFYKQPHSELSHKSASEWLKNPMTVHQSVKESSDTTRLASKFERKLDALVNKVTPDHLKDSMQDVVIESSRGLSEYFVAENYKALVKDALISEMQKRGNDTLIEKGTKSESNFFAAQRLKKVRGQVPIAPPDEDPPPRTIGQLCKRLEDTIRCRSMPRKLIGTMKEHIRNTSHYLSNIVTTPDPTIEAYVALLEEMDAQGHALLIEGDIPKSYKDSAAYLRSLTSCDDQVNLPNSTLEGATTTKLLNIMKDVPDLGYTKADLDGVIRAQAKLLVSYIMLQEQKTALLKLVVERMSAAPDRLLLRHGAIRKSNCDGAHLLLGKNTDQLQVAAADPVVERKVQIKVVTLMEGSVPENQKEIMNGVISDSTRYLAVHLLKPNVIKVCKCMKSVFVQCELWCDEILRRMSRPCCSCSRQLSVAALADLVPGEMLVCPPGIGHAYAPGVDISIRPCSRSCRRGYTSGNVCPAPEPTEGCQSTASYLLYSTEYNRQRQYVVGPTRLPRSSPLSDSPRLNSSTLIYSSPEEILSSSFGSLDEHESRQSVHQMSSNSVGTSRYKQSYQEGDTTSLSYYYTADTETPVSSDRRNNQPLYQKTSTQVEKPFSELGETQLQSFENRTPIVTTDQMVDWHSMMVSLVWNVQAWRKWIQDTIDRALLYDSSCSITTEKSEETWIAFRRKIATEALQWHQYNIFSRQLIIRLSLRYKDRKIVSPTRATVKNRDYVNCQSEMLQIIDMFNRWTRWLSIIVKETDLLQPSTDTPIQTLRWDYFKNKVEECVDDWKDYNSHLKIYLEHQFMELIPECSPAWNQGGPVWVVSACGAVPSGAVAAGAADGEPTWVARTTHRRRVLPAALRPSQHSCVLYADGAAHHYTKYQVLCNAEAAWVPWRAGRAAARAVRVAPRVHAGRVLFRGAHLLGAVPAPAYRCHVVIFGRPFAFNAYELLVLTGPDP